MKGNQAPDSIAPPLKWHGGKGAFNGKLAKWLISLMPPRSEWCHYVEPYFGGGSVMLHMDPNGVSEVANDINGDLINFWRAIRDEGRFQRLRRAIESTPFAEEEWELADAILNDPHNDSERRAWAFFVLCRQSLAGRMKSFAPLSKTRTRSGMNEQASAWLNAIEGLPAVHARLKRVVILNRDAVDVIREQDGSKTLAYIDPPYLTATREAKAVYSHEMSDADHVRLLDALAAMKGRFILSGYRSQMYDSAAALHGWHRRDFEIVNNAAGGAAKRTMVECAWMNYEPPTTE